ncbi:MAG: hemerythrin domain-containing protein [Candidatus Thorarchaeota archaeon]
MVKRHEGLVPLSQEHFHHLVFANRLMYGKPDNKKSKWPQSIEEQASLAKLYFEKDMLSHFELEEKVVFPVYDLYLTDNDPKRELLNKILKEHIYVKGLIADLRSNKNNELELKLRDIGEHIEKHIRTEERKLYEDIQETIPNDELIAIGKILKDKSSMTCFNFL